MALMHSYCFEYNGTKLHAWIDQHKHFIVGKKLLGCYQPPLNDPVCFPDDRILLQFENCCFLFNVSIRNLLEFSVYLPDEYTIIENRLQIKNGSEFENASFLGMYGGTTTNVTCDDCSEEIQIYQEGLPPILIGGEDFGDTHNVIRQDTTTFDLLKFELSAEHVSVPRILYLLFPAGMGFPNDHRVRIFPKWWPYESFEEYSCLAYDMRLRAERTFPAHKTMTPFVDLWASANSGLDIRLDIFRELLALVPSKRLKKDREKRAITSTDECWKMVEEIYSSDNPFYSKDDNYDTAEVYYTLANIMKTITLPMSVRILRRLETIKRILNQHKGHIFSDELNPTLWELFHEINECANDIQSLHLTESKTKLIIKVLHVLEFGIIIAEEHIDELAKAPEETYYPHYRTILQALTAYSQHFQKLNNKNIDTVENGNQLKMLIHFINILEEKITHTTLSVYKEDLYNAYCQLIDIYEAEAKYTQAEEIRQRMYTAIRRTKPYS